MSLMDKIEHLQKKPEAVRRRVLFVILSVVMFAVVTVWVSTLRLSLNKEEHVAVASPFSVFKNIIKEGFDSSANVIKGGLNNVKSLEKVYGKE